MKGRLFMYLKSLYLKTGKAVIRSEYPFTIPVIQNLEKVEFNSKVTFFVGENGTGKSTLLEAIAYQCGFNLAGGCKNNSYDIASVGTILGEFVQLSWMPKVTKGFFLRAETFHNFASYLDSLGDYSSYGNKSLHKQSHGEAFFSIFNNRFGEKAIYLLDEPEAALSPLRQIAFLNLIRKLENTCQFIIATHSPIILGYPKAQILSFDDSRIAEIEFEQSSHYVITKRFLEDRFFFLK